ncbi:MAG: tRNA (cytidine(34)-2'-O)-methyltransferase [Bacilli bacterium]|nr:tRNA (cytidine(34)-2'-O)-methyltransferase [Bacilli bacterium]
MIRVILYHPEIPQNTGNIMRTCVAMNAQLIIIGPIPFSLDEKALKRAGMDYIKDLDMKYYHNYDEFYEDFKNEEIFYITRYANKTHSDVNFKSLEGNDINVMFGRESTGIDHDILRNHFDHCLRIPMVANARSMNLSNCVAIVVAEINRQLDFAGLERHEVIKGEDFLKKEAL